MSERQPETQPMTKERAIAEIEVIFGECGQMGANDYEPSTLRELQRQVEADEIDPAEAVGQAMQIRDRKQSYH